MAERGLGIRVRSFPELCPLSRTGKASCRRCQQVCPTGAVSLEAGPKIRWSACTGCGACAAVCPTGALEMPQLPALTADQDGNLVLACRAVRPQAPLPCLAALSPETLAQALGQTVRRVEVRLGECEACVNGPAVAARMPLVPWVTSVARALGLEQLEVVERRVPGRLAHMAPAVDRRWLLRLGSASSPPTRLPSWLPGREVADGKRGTVHRVGDCFLCPACVHACTAGALRIDEDKLFFLAERCNGCRACADACGFGALKVQAWASEGVQVLAEGKSYYCQQCGEPAVGTGKLCQRCLWKANLCVASWP